MTPLDPERDYYWEEGKMVLTAHFLKRRGYCCESGCRHCPYGEKVISLVPSWTETLLEAGVQVVGRTRFCIHPAEALRSIPAVGGTKSVDWSKAQGLGATVVLLDKEENTLPMHQSSPWPTHVTHITSVRDVGPALEGMAQRFQRRALRDLSRRWKGVVEGLSQSPQKLPSWRQLPGVLEWWRTPTTEPLNYVYVIWSQPWMVVRSDTFIGSLFDLLGYSLISAPSGQGDSRYPTVDLLKDFDPETTCLLFSSEPYPFARKKGDLAQQPFASALVDGEVYSWFGLRSLRFLEQQFSLRSAGPVE